MKYRTIISLILLPQMVSVLGAVVPDKDNSLISLQKRNLKDNIKGKLNHVGEEKAKALKVAGQGIKVAGKGVQVAGKGIKVAGNGVKVAGGKGVKTAGKGVKVVGNKIQKVEGELQRTFTLGSDSEETWDELRDVLSVCAKNDCKRNNFFMNEALRWVKHGLKDLGVVIHENPAATAALVIGVSVLLIELIGGGMIVPALLRAIGFGTKGPIKNSIAAAVQRVINPVKLGSVFSQFQSAAMHGAALKELQNIAYVAITGLIGVGVAGLVEGGTKSHNQPIYRQEWQNWASESILNPSSDITNNATQLWGAPAYRGCVAYGYQEVRASLVSVPESMDPLAACKQTPALIEDNGFKTPLNCLDEGPKKGVTGLWYVPTNTTQCTPWWGKFEDEVGSIISLITLDCELILTLFKGCMLYGRRRRFARLIGLKNNGDWKGVCESAPASIDGKHYDHPSYCDDKGVAGIYGVFDVVDEQCECSCVRV
ncbi:unnamed protein product [Rhizoctonia solani]|uniref:Uncharacterized protein n=1 Tax=Rhizoctonia solani TaxID=456999 RepID=A0A8H3E5T4_9AGAM|nr:unnamed protein product [Rhizoctonia solani]